MSEMKIRLALAGNPNTGKSTLFNALTGLKQHTGNWPGKTVAHAEGEFSFHGKQYTLVDLPGTYSLYSNSADEEVARDYIIFQKPDVTIVVLDATAMERNMNLALQVLEMTSRVVICINLMDEAEKKGISVNENALSEKLGVPVVKISARNKKGFTKLLQEVEKMAILKENPAAFQIQYSAELEEKISELEPLVSDWLGESYPARWIALRLLDGDEELIQKLKNSIPEKLEKEADEHAVQSGLR
ncbi:50S ribosome-binding GTPase [Metabacillus sp. GX 13764]|uniref:FeoB small GTPase domain-containing protein n=1 Tax=Metabacillus kandeliae TaxID=2900151 RepID=UPI001E2DC199|nr:FeoB small GTPase domain-containing protein [Metabacillus kandeliae]MCD7035071.1 50S ribosome-binding GTPase [Metabacillus kandeliae]